MSKKPYTIVEQLFSLWKTFKMSVKEGVIVASDEKAKERLRICHSNECGYYNDQQNKCELCGCNIFMKVNIEKTECPDGKW